MTQRSTSHILESRSRDRVKAVFHDHGFVVDDLHEDYGEDMLVRVFREGRATPYSFLVQVKARAKSINGAFATVRVKRSHVDHWARLIQPVFIVLWSALDGSMLWESVTHAIKEHHGPAGTRTLSLRIPLANKLDSQGILRMRNISREVCEMLTRERAGGELLCQLLEKYTAMRVADYSPRNEVLILDEPKGGCSIYFFGKLLELLEVRLGKKRGAVAKFLKAAIRRDVKGRIEIRDGKILYFDAEGRLFERLDLGGSKPTSTV